MSEARIRTEFVSPGLVWASFSLSGLASCLTTVVTLKSRVGGLPIIVIGVVLLLFLSGAWAASSLRIGRRAQGGVGLAIAIGTTGSFFPILGTQIKGNETVSELLLGFGTWFVVSHGIGSAVGLLPMLTHGAKVFAIGVLGFCVGAAISALPVALALTKNLGNTYVGYLGVTIIFFPGIVGGVSLAWALNSVYRTRTAGEP